MCINIHIYIYIYNIYIFMYIYIYIIYIYNAIYIHCTKSEAPLTSKLLYMPLSRHVHAAE